MFFRVAWPWWDVGRLILAPGHRPSPWCTRARTPLPDLRASGCWRWWAGSRESAGPGRGWRVAWVGAVSRQAALGAITDLLGLFRRGRLGASLAMATLSGGVAALLSGVAALWSGARSRGGVAGRKCCGAAFAGPWAAMNCSLWALPSRLWHETPYYAKLAESPALVMIATLVLVAPVALATLGALRKVRGEWQGTATYGLMQKMATEFLAVKASQPVNGFGYFVAMPSLHVAVAVVLQATWRHRPVRFWSFLPVNLAVCASTVVLGYHYLLDLPGGVALAGLVLGADHLIACRSNAAVSGAFPPPSIADSPIIRTG